MTDTAGLSPLTCAYDSTTRAQIAARLIMDPEVQVQMLTRYRKKGPLRDHVRGLPAVQFGRRFPQRSDQSTSWGVT